jgi:hypothetical protein
MKLLAKLLFDPIEQFKGRRCTKGQHGADGECAWRGRRWPPVRSLWWERGEAMVVAADPIDSALTTEVRRTEAPWCDNRIGINRGLPRLDHGNIHQAPWEPAHELQIEQPVTVVCECEVERPRTRNGLGGNDRGFTRET